MVVNGSFQRSGNLTAPAVARHSEQSIDAETFPCFCKPCRSNLGQDRMDSASTDFATLTADVVAAYVSNNAVQMAELPNLIGTVHTALSEAANGKSSPAVEKPTPHMAINKTVTADFIVSLEDGRRYKTLRRHLARRGLTPEQYRAKWGLTPGYPMVAANYSKRRSELAKELGLGQAQVGKKKRARQSA